MELSSNLKLAEEWLIAHIGVAEKTDLHSLTRLLNAVGVEAVHQENMSRIIPSPVENCDV